MAPAAIHTRFLSLSRLTKGLLFGLFRCEVGTLRLGAPPGFSLLFRSGTSGVSLSQGLGSSAAGAVFGAAAGTVLGWPLLPVDTSVGCVLADGVEDTGSRTAEIGRAAGDVATGAAGAGTDPCTRGREGGLVSGFMPP